MRFVQEYRDSSLSRSIIRQISEISCPGIRIMEVCGTHTVSIFRYGIRTVLPGSITLISGPGCPVCVTDQSEIDTAAALAAQKDVTAATFGDLIRVPGTFSSLKREQACGSDIRVVYSAYDAVETARRNPDRQVVFLGIGFETTAPTVAASILCAWQEGLENFSVYSCHKLMPPALDALVGGGIAEIDGLLLPGHVSVIIGKKAYQDFFEKFRIPCAVAGFEPVDILQAVHCVADMVEKGKPSLENCYPRAVSESGNEEAERIMYSVFEPCDASWRGIGRIPGSGLRIREEYADFDAARRFDISVTAAVPPSGCVCGEVLTGRKTPPECPLYKRKCTPANPVGPCMVSSEGACAAYFKYEG